MASVGHTGKHNVHPTQSSASIFATAISRAGSISGASMFNIDASFNDVSEPPGGHLSIPTSSLAIASAYGRHPGYPHSPHCNCGRTSSIDSTNDEPDMSCCNDFMRNVPKLQPINSAINNNINIDINISRKNSR